MSGEIGTAAVQAPSQIAFTVKVRGKASHAGFAPQDGVHAIRIAAIQDADMLIIGGTSLIVYPAAGLIDYYRGNKLVVINMTVTSQDKNADLVIQEPIGKVFAGI